ncbi:MAG: Stp1/IreP family PP2C-type Ser/Thr phosphatase [bacterium]|nr:Stp1/IreP family PP2C-type Ser/Thr phosphatase [bacterium]
MKTVASFITDKGPVREKNEDYFCVDAGLGLYAVADGIGGHTAGEVASRMAVEVIKDFLSNEEKYEGDKAEGYRDDYSRESNMVAEAVRRANTAIHETSKNNSSYRGMGTTLTAALIRGDRLSIAHVGDSRAYLIRTSCIEQITNDHSLVAEQVKMGLISDEEARNSKIKNVITRSLGNTPHVEVDIEEFSIADGDRIIICSDGITSVISDSDILSIASASGGPADLCKTLVKRAADAGCTDNMTVVALHVYKDVLSYLYHFTTDFFRS